MFRRLALAGMGILAVQGMLMLALSRKEYLPSPPPLSDFPSSIGDWEAAEDIDLDPQVLEMLTPDDVLNREYANRDRTAVLSLFVAYYKTQHKAGHAHDPKVCLPGSGWNPIVSKTIEIPVPDSNASFPANYYVIEKESQKDVVLYWYQSYNGVTAQEEILKLDRVFETLKSNRTDMALVRIAVPVDGADMPQATNRATRFAQAIFPFLRNQFPPRAS